MPRAVITGGAGFLGSHLCERLLDDRYEVIALDNFLTGGAEKLRQPRLTDPLPHAADRDPQGRVDRDVVRARTPGQHVPRSCWTDLRTVLHGGQVRDLPGGRRSRFDRVRWYVTLVRTAQGLGDRRTAVRLWLGEWLRPAWCRSPSMSPGSGCGAERPRQCSTSSPPGGWPGTGSSP